MTYIFEYKSFIVLFYVFNDVGHSVCFMNVTVHHVYLIYYHIRLYECCPMSCVFCMKMTTKSDLSISINTDETSNNEIKYNENNIKVYIISKVVALVYKTRYVAPRNEQMEPIVDIY